MSGTRLAAASAVAFFLLSACGGTRDSGETPALTPLNKSPRTTAVPVTLHFAVPENPGTRAHFISPATNEIAGEVYPASDPSNVTRVGYDVGPSSNVCQAVGGVYQCTVTIDAPVGSDDFVFDAIERLPGSVTGALPKPPAGKSYFLGQTPVIHATVVANQYNTVDATIEGIISGFVPVKSPFPFLWTGYSQTVSIPLGEVNPLDYAGFVIGSSATDPFFYPIVATLKETGGSGFATLKLVQGGATQTGASVKLNYIDSLKDSLAISFTAGQPKPGYYVSVTYSAQSFTGPQYTQAVTPSTFTFAPLLTGTPATTQLTYVGQAVTITASQAFATYLTAKSTNKGVVSVTPASAPAGPFTVTAKGPGRAVVSISDGANQQNFSFTVTTTYGVIH